MRSLDEILTRGGQAISVFREQARGNSVPTDNEFERLIDRENWGSSPAHDRALKEKFYTSAQTNFFPVFEDIQTSAASFRDTFGNGVADYFVTAAEQIVDGRIDLLGLKALYVGKEIDWHWEPVASKRSPLKHWKQFDELDTAETGNKKIIWELNRHQHFFTLGVAYWLTADERFAKTFVNHLRSWIETNPPGIGINWSSSLEVSFRAMSWMWGLHFFRNSEHVVSALLKNAVKILYLHGRHIEKYLSRYYSPNTHLTGEALGLYYLGTQLPFLERAKHWRTLGENILLDEVTRQLHPDGVYFEQSTWYQRYTVDIFSQFLLLRSRNDGQILTGKGAELEVRLQRAYDFLMHSTFPNGRTPLIGDDDGGRLLPLTNSDPDDFRGTLAVGAVLFEQSGLRYVAGGVSQEVFWLQGPKRINDFESLPAAEPATESASFPDGGYYIMRDGWSETDNCLMFDCGEVGALTGAHGHSDTLGIEVAIRGKTLLVDSGTFTYHDSAELRNYFRSSSAHNTLTIDGLSSSEPASAFNWKSRAQAEAHHWLSKPRFDFFKGSHTGYERFGDGATHTRSVLFIKGDYWIMRDFIGGTGSHEYSLDFHYAIDRKPVVEKDDRWIGDPDHRLFVFGDNGAWRQKESWVSNHHGSRDNASFLSYVSRGLGPQEFFTFVLPVDSANEPMVQEAATTSGRAFFIKYDGYTDLFVFNDDSSQVVDNGVFRSNFEYSWARLRASESLPDEFILINGDRFAIGDKEMFESHEVNSASARRFGNELYIATDLGRTIKTL